MPIFFESRDKQLYLGPMVSDPYPLHMHWNVEVVCILSGSCTMQIDDKTRELTAGDFAIIFPLIPHSYDFLSEDCRGFTSYFRPNTITEFTQTFLMLLPDDPVIPGAALNDDVRYFIDKLRAAHANEHCPYRLAYLHLLLAYILNRMTFHSVGPSYERSLAAQTAQYVYEHACENITINSTAHALGISSSHLSHLFSSQFHINFRRFVNATRINRATVLMRDPSASLTQICYDCGYENMRTFRRAFVQETGMLPSEYLRRNRAIAQDDI